MKLIIRSQIHEPPPCFASGGVGEIYRIKQGVVAKIFHPEKRDTERRLKVLALCNSFQNHASQLGSTRYAFPEDPAYEDRESFNNLAGFSMRDFGDIPEMGDLGFNLKRDTFLSFDGNTLTPARAITLVYELFELLDNLHQARIVLGDINPRNILYSPTLNRPVIIDIDSAQIGQFFCSEVTPDFMAPELHSRGSNLAGFYNFDVGSDVFALAAVCFEFLIGIDPNFIITVPASNPTSNRIAGISSIRYFTEGNSPLLAQNLSFKNCPENAAVQKRLDWLKQEDRALFNFFVAVFVANERSNLLAGLPVTNPLHPGYHFYQFRATSGFGAVIEKHIKVRDQAIPPMPKQPQASANFPDSGFQNLFSTLTMGAPPTAPSPREAKPKNLFVDPQQFDSFLKQFNLKY